MMPTGTMLQTPGWKSQPTSLYAISETKTNVSFTKHGQTTMEEVQYNNNLYLHIMGILTILLSGWWGTHIPTLRAAFHKMPKCDRWSHSNCQSAHTQQLKTQSAWLWSPPLQRQSRSTNTHHLWKLSCHLVPFDNAHFVQTLEWLSQTQAPQHIHKPARVYSAALPNKPASFPGSTKIQFLYFFRDISVPRRTKVTPKHA